MTPMIQKFGIKPENQLQGNHRTGDHQEFLVFDKKGFID